MLKISVRLLQTLIEEDEIVVERASHSTALKHFDKNFVKDCVNVFSKKQPTLYNVTFSLMHQKKRH